MNVLRSLGDAPPSFWLARQGVVRRVPFVVVGGGLVGLSTAYWLRQQGEEVLVLEAGHVAGRASGRNAGFLLTGSAEPFTRFAAQVGKERALAFWRRSRENRVLLRETLLDSGAIDCEFQQEGSFIAALADEHQVAELRASSRALAAAGFAFEWLEGAALARASGSAGLGAALFQPEDGGLDPVRLAQGIARVGGFEVWPGVRVSSLAPEGDAVRLGCELGDVVAERVVLALNAYAPELVPMLAAEVRPVRGQMLAKACGERTLRGVWYVDDGFQYLRQLPDGTLLMGGCRKVAIDDEVGLHETPTPVVQAALEAFLAEFFPRFAAAPVLRRWAGIMAFTPDGLPRIGALAHLPGVVYAAGLNGHGISLGFLLGRHLAALARGQTPPPFLPPA